MAEENLMNTATGRSALRDALKASVKPRGGPGNGGWIAPRIALAGLE
jgi:hypothetical protein